MDQTGKLRPGRVRGRREDQLVYQALAAAAAMDEEIFHIFQPGQMLLQRRIAPCGLGPDVFAAETKVRSVDLEFRAFPLALVDPLSDEPRDAVRNLLEVMVERARLNDAAVSMKRCNSRRRISSTSPNSREFSHRHRSSHGLHETRGGNELSLRHWNS
jgi:hypothetical protein